ncbi:hypothetical protein COV82_04420 [Candidatus Peregrinibacteria bacterium CG11_big_fil_rev_8_21_14_0_20_46_8]|nr:MAG: hypothetical protein COV82_04420 [Candidatus Peregrinibacteria bacterium CG11_big_fil_rev_8_21_14_0_20_46_8]
MHRTPLSQEVRKSLNMLMFTLFGMLLAISIYFFLRVTSTAEIGYLMRQNQTVQAQLETENRILKQKVMEAQSITTIKEESVPLQQPTGTHFVHPRRPLSSTVRE